MHFGGRGACGRDEGEGQGEERGGEETQDGLVWSVGVCVCVLCVCVHVVCVCVHVVCACVCACVVSGFVVMWPIFCR